MAWITCVVAIEDSNGVRIDSVNSVGEYQPVVLKLASGFVSSASDRGDGMTEVALTVDGTGIPLGAANTVYSSDGATNDFRTNVAVTSLRATSYLGVGSSGYLPTYGGLRLANGYASVVGRDTNGDQFNMLSVTGANAIGVGSTRAVLTAYGTDSAALVVGNGKTLSAQGIESTAYLGAGSGLPTSGALRLGINTALTSTWGPGTEVIELAKCAGGVPYFGDIVHGANVIGGTCYLRVLDTVTTNGGLISESYVGAGATLPTEGAIRLGSGESIVGTFDPGTSTVNIAQVDESGVTQIGDVDYGSRILGIGTAGINIDQETLIKGSVVDIETRYDGSVRAVSTSGLTETFVPSLTLPSGETTNRIKRELFMFTKASPDASPITFDVNLSYYFGLETYKIFGVKARILSITSNSSGSGEIEAAASYKYSGTTLTMMNERLPTGEVLWNRMDNYAAIPTLAFLSVSNSVMRMALTPAGTFAVRWVVIFDIVAYGNSA